MRWLMATAWRPNVGFVPSNWGSGRLGEHSPGFSQTSHMSTQVISHTAQQANGQSGLLLLKQGNRGGSANNLRETQQQDTSKPGRGRLGAGRNYSTSGRGDRVWTPQACWGSWPKGRRWGRTFDSQLLNSRQATAKRGAASSAGQSSCPWHPSTPGRGCRSCAGGGLTTQGSGGVEGVPRGGVRRVGGAATTLMGLLQRGLPAGSVTGAGRRGGCGGRLRS